MLNKKWKRNKKLSSSYYDYIRLKPEEYKTGNNQILLNPSCS